MIIKITYYLLTYFYNDKEQIDSPLLVMVAQTEVIFILVCLSSAVRVPQHAPGSCQCYIKHYHLTLDFIPALHLLQLLQQPLLHVLNMLANRRTIPLHYNRPRAQLTQRTLKLCPIQSLTWWIQERRGGMWKMRGYRIEGSRVRHSDNVMLWLLQWKG